VWTFGRGHLPRVEAAIRSRSFWWPTAEVLVGLVVFGFLVVADRRRQQPRADRHFLLRDPSRTAGVILLVSSTGFLIALGAPWWSSNTSFLAPTPAEVALQRAVGTSIVGFGNSLCWFRPTLGIQPDANIVYGVHEFDAYDPLTPAQLYKSWTDSTGHAPRSSGPYAYLVPISMFCPSVRTAAEARLFGIGFVLEPAGAKGPKGSVFDMKVGHEELYRIPGASLATVTPLGSDGSLPGVEATGTPVAVSYPSPTSWKVVTHADAPQVLRLRLTDVPGWHASIDGKPLVLTRFNRVMLQAKIPAGTHTIELHYWPSAFTAGIAIAVVTVIGLVLLLVLGRRVKERRSRAPDLPAQSP